MTIVTRYCGKFYSFYDLMFARYLLTSILFFGLMRIRKVSFRTEHVGLHFVRCFFGVLTAAVNTYLIFQLPAAVAQCFNYTSAFWIVLLLLLISIKRRESFPFWVIAPVFAGFLGVLVILNPDFSSVTELLLFLCLSYGFFAAGSSLSLKALGRYKESALRIAFYYSLACTVFGAALSLGNGTTEVWRLFLDPFVLLSVAFALMYQIARTLGWEYGNPLINSVFLFLGIPFVLTLGLFFLDEFPKNYQIAGMALIILSALVCYRFMDKSSLKK